MGAGVVRFFGGLLLLLLLLLLCQEKGIQRRSLWIWGEGGGEDHSFFPSHGDSPGGSSWWRLL